MKRHWTPAELLERWTLSPPERALVDEARADHTRLGMACLLKGFQLDWRFPRRRAEVPVSAIAHLAAQLGVPAGGRPRLSRGVPAPVRPSAPRR